MLWSRRPEASLECVSSGDTWIARGLCLGPAWHLDAFPTLSTFCPASCLYSGAATAPEMVTSLFDEGQPLPPSHPWDLLPDLTLLPPEDHATPAPSCCLCIAFQPWWLSQLPFSVNADCLVYYFYFSFLSLCLSYECVSCTCRSVCVETRGRFGDQFSPSTVRSVD